jgi:RNA polymerase sigma-70 factor (ECF subfamily)
VPAREESLMPDEAHNAPPDDPALMKQVKAGDPVAITTFYEIWFPRFYGLAYRLTGDTTASEDLAQEAVIHAITNADKCWPGKSAGPWLRAILRNRVIDWARRKNVRFALSVHEPGDGHGGVEVETREPTAQEVLEAGEKSDVVQAALLKLTAAEREILLLRYYDGLATEEIAKVLEISVEKVGSRLFRARRRLAAQLQTDWPSLFPSREL